MKDKEDVVDYFDNSTLNPQLKEDPKYCFRVRVIGNNTELSTQDVENTINKAIRDACEEDKLSDSVAAALAPVYTLLVLNRTNRKGNKNSDPLGYFSRSRLICEATQIYDMRQAKPNMKVSPVLLLLNVIDAKKALSGAELVAFSSPAGFVFPGSEITDLALFVLRNLQSYDDYKSSGRIEIAARACAEASITTRKPTQEGITAKEVIAFSNKAKRHRASQLKLSRIQRTLKDMQRLAANMYRSHRKEFARDVADFYAKGTRKR